MRVALIQLLNTDDKEYNLVHAAEMIAEAAKDGTDMVVLPEMFFFSSRNRSFIMHQ